MNVMLALYIMYQKLSLVNGVIFTGGSAKAGLYFEVVTSIFKVHDESMILVAIETKISSFF